MSVPLTITGNGCATNSEACYLIIFGWGQRVMLPIDGESQRAIKLLMDAQAYEREYDSGDGPYLVPMTFNITVEIVAARTQIIRNERIEEKEAAE